jgi:cytoskeletal protein CcmA (bactofilin family)
MLKSFKQPGTTGNSRIDPTRTSHHAGYAAQPAETHKPAAEEPKDEAAPVTAKPASSDEGSKLIVGPNIKLKGSEITDCEILVVEGRVEASMNSRDIRIAEGGVFAGKAEIDVAEVRGTFEGELTARKRLVVYATGRVNGTIRYGALMVEEGGTISGNMAKHTAGPSLATVPGAPVQAPVSEPAQDKAAELEEIRSAAAFGLNQKRG